MQELGAEAMRNPEKKLKPLFTSGSGQKRSRKEFVESRWYAIFS